MVKIKFSIVMILSLAISMRSFAKENCIINSLIAEQISELSNCVQCNYDSLLKLMNLNDPQSIGKCYFPQNDLQQKLLLRLVDSSLVKSKVDLNSLRFIIRLYLNEKYNVELKEYVSAVLPYAINNNLIYYLSIYHDLNERERKTINGTFVLMTSKNDFQNFINLMDSIINDIKELKRGVLMEINK